MIRSNKLPGKEMIHMGVFRNHRIKLLLASSLALTSMPAYSAEPITVPAKPHQVSAQETQAMENAKISKDKALQIANKSIDIPAEYTQRNVEFQSKWWGSNSPAWVFYWDHQGPDYGSIQIAVDANSGSILNIDMYTNEYDPNATYPPKVDLGKAKDLAMEFILKHFPDKKDEIVYDNRFEPTKPPLQGSVVYPVTYKRKVNGILFDNNEIRVNINGNGKVTGFSYRWNDNIQFPVAQNVMSEEAMTKLYEDQLDLSLRLIRYWGPRQKNEPDPIAYVPQTFDGAGYYGQQYFRATDGALVTPWGDIIANEQIGLVQISDKKLGEMPAGKTLTQEQALTALRKHFSMPEDTKIINASYREENIDNPVSVWDFNWEQNINGITRGWSSASIDAVTGRILNYNNSDQVYFAKGEGEIPVKEKTTPKISREEAQKQVVELVKKLNPDLTNQIYFVKMPPNPYQEADPRIYYFSFAVQQHGVTLENQSIGVSVDAETGKISNYWFDPYNLKLPKEAPSVVNKKQAKKTYMDMVELKLTYVLPQEKPSIYGKPGSSNTKAMLVYEARMKNSGEPIFLDAKTGLWTNRETKKPINTTENISDIKGHQYEKELRLLLHYDIFDIKDGKIAPDEQISRGEMIKMLMLVQNNGYPIWFDSNRAATFSDVSKESDYFGYIENAVQQNLIDATKKEFRPNEKIDREELANLIVKALGYSNLMEVPNLFNNDLTDTNSMENPAAAILVTKLGIMDAENKTFKPAEKVTRAEAAVAFYHFLSKRNQGGEIRY